MQRNVGIAELRLRKRSKTRKGRYKRCSAGLTTGTAITGGTTGGASGGKTGQGKSRDVHRRFRRLDTGWTTFASKHLASPKSTTCQRVKRKRLRTKTTTVVVSSWRVGKTLSMERRDCRRNGGVCQTEKGASGRLQVAGTKLHPLWSALFTGGLCNFGIWSCCPFML